MILLTGFEPFGSFARNPSGEAAMALDGGEVCGAVLPVDYKRIGPAVRELLEDPWDAVVLTGLAQSRSEIALERVAINLRESSSPDNAGSLPVGDEVVPGGPAAYFSSLPLAQLHEDLARAGVPVNMSLSAGAYLCNAAFYLARHQLDAVGTPCGFFHLPPTTDQATGHGSLPFDETLRGLRLILKRLLTN